MARGTEAGRRAPALGGALTYPYSNCMLRDNRSPGRDNKTMSNRRRVFSTANLLVYLEATSLGLVDVEEGERRQALEAAEEVKNTQSRKWRAHRRPSPGKSRRLRVGQRGARGEAP
jgi:hypothetical protein